MASTLVWHTSLQIKLRCNKDRLHIIQYSCSLSDMDSEETDILHTRTQFISMQTGEQASFCWRENGECEGRDEGDKCPPGPWGYPNGVIHHHSQSHAEQSCQCMNAALLLSAILIMAPVTALINTITSHWKSLRKTLPCCCVPATAHNTGSKLRWGWGEGL